jgi:DNA-binding PadR family transcriptional regulator
MSKKCPSPPRDKRSKLDLELLVLALIQRGVNTPYRLLSSAGISQGATLPVLSRLESSSYVRRGKPGPRGRTEYEVTAAGRRYLQAGWQPLLEAPIPGDIESVLRAASLAVLSGADSKTVSGYLKRAADAKVTDSKLRKAVAKETKPSLLAEPDAGLYIWMLATNAAAQLATEGRILRQLATALNRRS